jgi:hypothetical protein
MWIKAQELFHRDHPEAKGVTPTKKEMREGGYWYEAKILVLREVYRERHGLSSPEEEMFEQQYREWLEENKDVIQRETH